VAPSIADSNVTAAALSGGAAAEQMVSQKSAKHNLLTQRSRLFQLIAA